jgi:hypothetical protein
MFRRYGARAVRCGMADAIGWGFFWDNPLLKYAVITSWPTDNAVYSRGGKKKERIVFCQ